MIKQDIHTFSSCHDELRWVTFDVTGNVKEIQLKGPAHSKKENLYFLASAQTKRMQPILVSCKAPLRSNLQKTLV